MYFLNRTDILSLKNNFRHFSHLLLSPENWAEQARRGQQITVQPVLTLLLLDTLLSSTNVFSQLSHHLSGGIARIAKPCYASVNPDRFSLATLFLKTTTSIGHELKQLPCSNQNLHRPLYIRQLRRVKCEIRNPNFENLPAFSCKFRREISTKMLVSFSS